MNSSASPTLRPIFPDSTWLLLYGSMFPSQTAVLTSRVLSSIDRCIPIRRSPWLAIRYSDRCLQGKNSISSPRRSALGFSLFFGFPVDFFISSNLPPSRLKNSTPPPVTSADPKMLFFSSFFRSL